MIGVGTARHGELDATRTLAALAHPIRLGILAHLRVHDVASPSDIAAALVVPLGKVSYHVRRLERFGLIDLVESRQRRGAIQHYYRLSPTSLASEVIRQATDSRPWADPPLGCRPPCESGGVGVAGHDIVPYPVFRAALDAGDLPRVRALAARMPSIGLHDALRICLLMRDQPGYERAAVRWLGRFAIEGRHVDVEAIQEAATALDVLPYRPDAAMETLARVCGRCGVA